MAKPSIPTTLPASLSPAVVPLSLTPGIGRTWDVGIDGVGYMLSTLDIESPFEFRSYEIQAIPKQKPRIDDAEEPGEQTLAAWWARAQHSWHEGAGQHIFDSPFSSRFKFCQSFGCNIWDDVQVTLLKDTAELRNDNVDDHHLLATPNALFYTFNGNLKRDPDPDASGEGQESTLSTHSGTEINSIASDGESIYAAFSGGALGIKKSPISGTLAWSDVNDQTAVEIIAWVKGRLMGAKGPSLYEYDLSSTTAPEPFYTDPVSAWEWKSISETGPAIYFAGALGDRSEIFAARLTAQDIPFASVATVGALRSVWQAPEGETIHTIQGYLGKQLLIGTSLGVRVGTVSTGEGDIDVSPLLTRSEHGGEVLGPEQPILAFEPQLEFGWFSWSQFDGTYSGLGRLHLGELNYASDLMFASQGQVTDIAYYNDRLYFVVDEGTTSRIIKEHATDLIASGWIQNCEIRFGTTERKIVRYFDILVTDNGKWSLEISQNGGNFVAYTTDNAPSGYQEEILDLEAVRFGNKITFKRDDADATLGPTLREWRMRAEPKAVGRFRYFVTVMVYDFVETKTGVEEGKNGRAMELLNHLTDLYRSDPDIVLQGPETGIPNAPAAQLVKMEDLRFKMYAPPDTGRGYGGLALAIFREVR